MVLIAAAGRRPGAFQPGRRHQTLSARMIGSASFASGWASRRTMAGGLFESTGSAIGRRERARSPLCGYRGHAGRCPDAACRRARRGRSLQKVREHAFDIGVRKAVVFVGRTWSRAVAMPAQKVLASSGSHPSWSWPVRTSSACGTGNALACECEQFIRSRGNRRDPAVAGACDRAAKDRREEQDFSRKGVELGQCVHQQVAP